MRIHAFLIWTCALVAPARLPACSTSRQFKAALFSDRKRPCQPVTLSSGIFEFPFCRRVRFAEGADEIPEEMAAAAAASGAADAVAAPSGSAFDSAAAEAPALPSRAGVLSSATAAPVPARRQRLMYTKSGEAGCWL